MGRRPSHPWNLVALAYLTGRCGSYVDVARAFKISVRQVERHARKQGWYQQRMTGDMTGILQNMINSVRTEDRDAVAELFKKKTDISIRMADLILRALQPPKSKGKKRKGGALAGIKSAFGQLELAKVAVKYMDQMQRATESAARVGAQVEREAPTPLMFNAPNAQTISVQQFITAVRGKGKAPIN